jgi:hypothetical protein
MMEIGEFEMNNDARKQCEKLANILLELFANADPDPESGMTFKQEYERCAGDGEFEKMVRKNVEGYFGIEGEKE